MNIEDKKKRRVSPNLDQSTWERVADFADSRGVSYNKAAVILIEMSLDKIQSWEMENEK